MEKLRERGAFMSDIDSLKEAREKTRSMCRSSSAAHGSRPEPPFIGECWALLP